MMVYVTTTEQMDAAFAAWIEESGNEPDRRARQIVHRLYQAFMQSAQAKPFYKVTGLVAFSLEAWSAAFDQTIQRELLLHPEHEATIRSASEHLRALMGSAWGVRHKLIVNECLTEEECMAMDEGRAA